MLISEIIKQRNIRWLCHFTPRKNLKEIKRIGLKPRNLLDHTAIFTDSFRYDQNKNAICLSISKPNKWMFDMKRKQGFDLCLLLIDPAILYKKNCLFIHIMLLQRAIEVWKERSFQRSKPWKIYFLML